jgi:uncharacterized protein (DUF983 family)
MQPSRIRMLWRGATRRCARCGSGHLFRRWFSLVADCPRCGLHFEREAGYWTGALAINTVLVGGAFALTFIVTLILTVPDVPVAPVLAILIPIVLIGPLVTYPFSKTLWVSIDRAYLQRLDPNERPDEQVRHY